MGTSTGLLGSSSWSSGYLFLGTDERELGELEDGAPSIDSGLVVPVALGPMVEPWAETTLASAEEAADRC